MFSSTTKNARVDGGFLIADCRVASGEFQKSVLDLNRYIGNYYGRFHWEDRRFTLSARDIRLEGSTLHARLGNNRGGHPNAAIDLDERIINEDGHLKYHRPVTTGFIYSSRNVVMDGSVLRAECIKPDGNAVPSELDLDHVLGNIWGEFKWGHKNFSKSAKDIRLEGSVLRARLGTGHQKNYIEKAVDLNEGVGNDNGKLEWYNCPENPWATQDLGDHGSQLNRWHPLSTNSKGVRDKKYKLAIDEQGNCKTARGKSDKPLYRYEALKKRSNVRLVKIEPARATTDPISCTLVEAELDNATPFAALSYTWGSPFPPTNLSVEQYYNESTTIVCNGQSFFVKQNLHDALCRLRKRPATGGTGANSRNTELIDAVCSGFLTEVETALRSGADVAARDSAGRTALHYAAKFGHLEMAKALCAAGSDPHARCNSGKAPIDYAKEGHGRFVKATAAFLESRRHSDHKASKDTTSLRGNVTNLEYFWIDAICMNQLDEQEKSSQVALMGRIYQSADQVIAWLGREYQDPDDTTEELLQGAWRLEAARSSGRIPQDQLEQFTEDPVRTFKRLKRTPSWHAVIDWMNTIGLDKIEKWFISPPIFHRTWFERAWVMQEVLMAKDLTVVCGPYIFPWDIFMFMSATVEACRLLLSKDGIYSVFGSGTVSTELDNTKLLRGARALCSSPKRDEVTAIGLEQWRLAYKRQSQLPMVSALSLSRNQNASDPRDKVFSVLSFSPIGHVTRESPHGTLPDYTRSTEGLYVEVARGLLSAHGPCVLSLGGLSNGGQTKNLPSWVPDLNTPINARLRGINVMRQREKPSTQPDTESADDKFFRLQADSFRVTAEDELVVRGYVWDIVSETAASGLNNAGADFANLSRWLELLDKSNTPPSKKRAALRLTLAEGITVHSLSPEQQDTAFQNWLKFLTFCSLLGHEEHFRTSGLAYKEPNIYHHLKVGRKDTQIRALVEQAQTHLAALGIFLPAATAERWSGHGTYTGHNTHHYSAYYKQLIDDAIDYGQLIRDNDPSRRLLVTGNDKLLGTGPQETLPGDVICVVEGASVPYVMREGNNGKFQLVGEAYLFEGEDMEGLLREKGKRGFREIRIV